MIFVLVLFAEVGWACKTSCFYGDEKPSYIGMVCISVALCPIITPPFYHIYGAGGGDDFIVYARAVFPWGRNRPNQVTLCIVVFMEGWLGFATSLLFTSLASTGTRYGRFCGPPGEV